MEKNNQYDDYKEKTPWLRMIIIALIVAIIIFIILLLLRNCGKKSLRGDLVKGAEEYYDKYPVQLPKEVGECYTVTLKTLEKEGLVNSSKYSTCDTAKTYVNVCYLENGKYNYAATLACNVETTKYGPWKDGTPSDLVEGSDVRFLFTGEQFTEVEEGTTPSTVKYYYPYNTTSAGSEYYASVPAKGYNNKEGQTTGYKWYTESSEKTYWNNGEYSATAPTGYTNSDSENKVTKTSDIRPTDASYRTISEVTLYRKRTIASPIFICVVPGTDYTKDASIVSPYHCRLNESGFTQTAKVNYTCDGGNTFVAFGTVCQDYTEWTTDACTSSSTVECQTKTSYQYTDTVYKWYKLENVRKYYPSGAATASGEKTYYASSPSAGLVRDNETATQVYKWYKTSSSTTANMVQQWVQVTNGYVGLDELISTFNGLDYSVNSLSDIKAIQDIRYQYKMQYRNVEE